MSKQHSTLSKESFDFVAFDTVAGVDGAFSLQLSNIVDDTLLSFHQLLGGMASESDNSRVESLDWSKNEILPQPCTWI